MINLTTPELVELAKKGAIIQWRNSGKIEYLFYNHRTKKVRCKNLLTNQTNGIRLKYKKQIWFIRTIEENELIKLSDLVK